MSLINRYIARHILPACLLVLVIILGLDLLLAISEESDAVDKGASFAQIVTYVAYTAPYRAYQFMPLVVLVGALIGLGNLANSNELTVMRAAGLTLRRLSLGVLLAIGPLVVINAVMGEYLLPWSQQMALLERSEYRGVAAGKGFWLRDDDSYVFVSAVAPDNSLRGIYRYGFDEQVWQSSAYAKSAYHESGNWVLTDGQTSQRWQDKIVVDNFAEQVWPITLSTDLVAKLGMEPKYLAAADLYEYVDYLQAAGINADLFSLAFWKKLLQPLFTLSLVLVAMSFVFGSQRVVPMGQRVLFGVLTGLAFNYAQDILGPASSIFGFSPVLAYLLPIV
ncbi:MAG: LPS export ABC transporter permease LptG, partial [Gammaproteobacteria bacterium]|nr:LPS export ABC transporter permease LptG [Gammaproteobacteria bacterium]